MNSFETMPPQAAEPSKEGWRSVVLIEPKRNNLLLFDRFCDSEIMVIITRPRNR